MCGIVGYTGKGKAAPIILKGLERLEYRGYDSAGILTAFDGEFMVAKVKGDLCRLKEKTQNGEALKGSSGIGHNRWATHGKPDVKNAHPHFGSRFAVVHNGIIENYREIKSDILKNFSFSSDTDTEVIPLLMEKYTQSGESVCRAIEHLMSVIKGSYALAILDKTNPGTIYGIKNKSPLLAGCGEGFNMIASDISAMIENTNTFVEMGDMEYCVITNSHAEFFSFDGKPIGKKPFTATISREDMEKGAYPHYMLKEIEEQSAVIRRIIKKYTDKDGNLKIEKAIWESIKKADKIYIIACGTSYHAGLMGKFYFENISGKMADAYIASEFAFNMPHISKNPFFIFISQSGEPADLRTVAEKLKSMGYKFLAVTNAESSTLSREAGFVMPLYAGYEIAVASTKAYTAQIAVLAILATMTGNTISIDLPTELGIVANAMESLCSEKEKLKTLAGKYLKNSQSCFFIGRGIDYYVSLEAALKLKEISYIHTEGFPSGELKHGPIALIEKGTPVIGVITQKNTSSASRSNTEEVRARGANVLCISSESLSLATDEIILPEVHEFLTPLVSVIPAHYLTYYAALDRGCNIDKPRNLAKSVTVE